MNKVGRFAAYLIKKLWLASGIVLLLLALLVSFLRYGLPHADSQKQHVEQWLTEQLGTQVTIERLDARWHKDGPALVVHNLVLAGEQTGPLQLSVQRTYIDVDFWASLGRFQVVSNRFSLHGLEARIQTDRQSNGAELSYPTAVQKLFLQQLQRFSVHDSRILFIGNQHQRQVSIEELSWINQGDRHQGVGRFRLDRFTDSAAGFVLNLWGQGSEIQGDLYIDGSNIDIAPWLEQLAPDEVQLADSDVNLQLWASIEQAQFQDVVVKFGESQIRWQPESTPAWQLQSGQFFAQKDADEWLFNLHHWRFGNPQVGYETLSGSGRVDQQGQVTLTAEDVHLAPAMPLLALAGVSNEHIKGLSLEGRINLLSILFDQRGVAAHGIIKQLRSAEYKGIPGLQDASVELDWRYRQGRVRLTQPSGFLRTTELLGAALPIDKVQLDIKLETTENGLSVPLADLSVDSEWLQLTSQSSFDPASEQLSLFSTLSAQNVEGVKRLFPPQLMGENTRAYLNRALVAGDVEAISILWHGKPAAFPFSQSEGIFQTHVPIRNSEFSFNSEWPSLKNLDLDLWFENEALFMSASQGTLDKVAMQQLSASIPRLVPEARLHIDIDARSEAINLTNLMLASPLKDSVGSVLSELVFDGVLDANVVLDIPLDGPDVVASGSVSMQDVPLTIKPISTRLNSVSGSIQFKNEKVWTRQLAASLMGNPVLIRFDGDQALQGYLADVGLSGQWPVAPLVKQQVPGLVNYLSGVFDWRANLQLTIPEQGFDYNFQLTSDLQQLDARLPYPFTSQAGQQTTLLVDVSGNQQASQVVATLGDGARFEGIVANQEGRFSRAHLALGDNQAVSLGAGFSISANLESMQLAPWFTLVQGVVAASGDEQRNNVLPAPQRIFVNVGELNAFGQTFNKVAATTRYGETGWQLELAADEIRANISIAENLLTEGIVLDADYLYLAKWQSAEQQGEVDLSQVPPVTLRCGRCVYDGIELGKIDFVMNRSPAGLVIDKLQVDHDGSLLQATGAWESHADGMRTRLNGRFNSDDFGNFLSNFEVNSGIRDSEADVNFELYWDQAPYGFEFASLHGNVAWRLSDGYMTEVSDKGARLFSFLSLESLVRKLRLDFRDVFAKGFFYDKMSGTLAVNNGVVQTDDTVIDGAAGEMTLSGYTNLNDQTLDYQIAFRPKVTSSLPVIVAWMVNPATAIAALALNEVIDSAEVISSINYRLTGTLEQPSLTEVGRDSKDIQIPTQVAPVTVPKSDDAGASE